MRLQQTRQDTNQQTVHLRHADRNTKQTVHMPPFVRTQETAVPRLLMMYLVVLLAGSRYNSSQHKQTFLNRMIVYLSLTCLLAVVSATTRSNSAAIRCRNDNTKRSETTDTTACKHRARWGDRGVRPMPKEARMLWIVRQAQSFFSWVQFFVTFFSGRLDSTARQSSYNRKEMKPILLVISIKTAVSFFSPFVFVFCSVFLFHFKVCTTWVCCPYLSKQATNPTKKACEQ